MSASTAPAASLASAIARPAPVATPSPSWVVPDAPWRDGELLAFVRSWPRFCTRLPAELWLPVLDGAQQALNLAATKLHRSRSSAVELAELEHELLLAICDAQVRDKIVAARQSPMGALAVVVDERYRAQRSLPGASLDDDDLNLDGALRAAGRVAASACDVAEQLADESEAPLAVAAAEAEALLLGAVQQARLHNAVRRTVRLICGAGKLAESHERALAADIAPHAPELTVAQVLAVICAVLGMRGRRRRTSILGALLTSPEAGGRSLTVQYALAHFARTFNRD